MTIKKIRAYLWNGNRPSVIAWIVFAILFIIPFASFYYIDSGSLLIYQIDFWKSIFDGNGLRSFYDYVKERTYYTDVANAGGVEATYDFTMYIFLGIWGLPLYLIFDRNGIDVASSSFLGRLYGKAIDLVALAICAYLIYKICLELKIAKNQAIWAAFIACSSLFSFVAIAIDGQSDIIGIPFVLLGILYYIRKKWQPFVLFFMIAATCKMYALFIFVPLLLLKEKKIYKICLYTLEVLVLKLFWEFLFDPNSQGMLAKKAFEQDMFARLTLEKLPLANADVPTAVVLLVGLCAWCYLHKDFKNDQELEKYAIFIPLCSMVLVFISFESSTYWYIHMVPYLAIMMVYNSTNMKNNFIFESIGAAACILGNMGSRPWAFEIYLCPKMLLEKIFGLYSEVQNYYLLENLCCDLPITRYSGSLFGVFVVCMVVFVIMNRPSQISSASGNQQPIRLYSYLRLIMNYMIVSIPMVLFVYNVLFR